MDDKLIYPELSYKIIGCLFEVYKKLGCNHREKYYQKAVSNEFKNQNIKFKEQVPIKLNYKTSKIGQNFLDFCIEDKIILEIKIGSYFSKNNLEQSLSYLKATNMKLGIIANFTRDGVKHYRVLNLY